LRGIEESGRVKFGASIKAALDNSQFCSVEQRVGELFACLLGIGKIFKIVTAWSHPKGFSPDFFVIFLEDAWRWKASFDRFPMFLNVFLPAVNVSHPFHLLMLAAA